MSPGFIYPCGSKQRATESDLERQPFWKLGQVNFLILPHLLSSRPVLLLSMRPDEERLCPEEVILERMKRWRVGRVIWC